MPVKNKEKGPVDRIGSGIHPNGVKDHIKAIVGRALNLAVGDIADGCVFREDLNIDSLTVLEITGDIEREFGLCLTDAEIETIIGIESASRLVMKCLTERAGASKS